MVPDSTKLLLCNYDESCDVFETAELEQLWSGKWEQLMQSNSHLNRILASDFTSTTLLEIINNKESNGSCREALQLGISCLLLFCDLNWINEATKNDLGEIITAKWPENVDATSRLQQDSEEVDVNTIYPELLLLAQKIFDALCSVDECLLHLWWRLRCTVSHQRVLEGASPTLYSEVELGAAKLSNLMHTLQGSERLQVLLSAELSQAFLLYGRVQRANDFLDRAKKLAGLKLELRGILGKRTKFQQNELPQLALSCELDTAVSRPTAEESHGSAPLPAPVALQDDVRLDRIAYSEDIAVELPSLEQLLCLLTVQYLQKSQPKDSLADEEVLPYVEAVVAQRSGPWAVRVAALLARCRIEAAHRRTVERAMMQCEALVADSGRSERDVSRLSYLWGSGLAPARCRRQLLADLHLSLGLVKAALELYLRLQLWEDVIVCYTVLQLRHKAAEIIQQQIDIKPTPKLYCLLGDATDDVECYVTAWDLSEHRSSRAQRHWGNYLFNRKKYLECIPHFEKSLEINSLQERVWLRLGFAALETEQWETSATAYRRYTYLQPSTFEAWNNLAKVYVKQGDKPRAYRALIEALRFNYDNWKLWENVVAVSADTGHLEDVLRGCHRLLELRGGYRDAEVLELLARAVLRDVAYAEGNPAGRLRKRLLELLARVTSAHPTDARLWRVYADVSPTSLLRAQRLQKAYKGLTQESEWSSSPESCRRVVELSAELLASSLEARRGEGAGEGAGGGAGEAAQQLASARLSAQAALRAAERRAWPEAEAALGALREKYEEVMAFLKM